jgi:hypothetical protein
MVMWDSNSSIAAAIWFQLLTSLTDKLIGLVVCSGSDQVVGADSFPQLPQPQAGGQLVKLGSRSHAVMSNSFLMDAWVAWKPGWSCGILLNCVPQTSLHIRQVCLLRAGGCSFEHERTATESGRVDYVEVLQWGSSALLLA